MIGLADGSRPAVSAPVCGRRSLADSGPPLQARTTDQREADARTGSAAPAGAGAWPARRGPRHHQAVRADDPGSDRAGQRRIGGIIHCEVVTVHDQNPSVAQETQAAHRTKAPSGKPYALRRDCPGPQGDPLTSGLHHDPSAEALAWQAYAKRSPCLHQAFSRRRCATSQGRPDTSGSAADAGCWGPAWPPAPAPAEIGQHSDLARLGPRQPAAN
jgi:hypothetical protein